MRNTRDTRAWKCISRSFAFCFSRRVRAPHKIKTTWIGYKSHKNTEVDVVSEHVAACDTSLVFAYKLLKFLCFFESRLYEPAEKSRIRDGSSSRGYPLEFLGGLFDGAGFRLQLFAGEAHELLHLHVSSLVRHSETIRVEFMEMIFDEILKVFRHAGTGGMVFYPPL